MSISKWLTSSAAIIAVMLAGGGSAHALSLFSKQTTLADAGKWAKAWSSVMTGNCAVGTTTPICHGVIASVTGRVLDAEMQAVFGRASVRRVSNQGAWFWEWNYDVLLFGKTLASRAGQKPEANVVLNQLIGQPFITENAPFQTTDTVSITVDTGQISGLLGTVLGDETFQVHYGVSGGLSAQINVMPFTPYGPLATAVVQPRAEVVAASGKTYYMGVANAYIGTNEQWVQVLAPASNVRFEAALVAATSQAKLTMLPNIRALRGLISWWVDGKIFDIGEGSGDVWRQTSRYFLTLQPSTPSTLFDGVLTPTF